jgi:hypothetical protein
MRGPLRTVIIAGLPLLITGLPLLIATTEQRTVGRHIDLSIECTWPLARDPGSYLSALKAVFTSRTLPGGTRVLEP